MILLDLKAILAIKMKIIIASDPSCVIGSNGTLPWRIPEEMKLFRKFTSGGTVFMGANTWKSIGEKPLPGRINYVVTHSKIEKFSITLEDMKRLQDCDLKNFWIIGGADLLNQILSDPSFDIEKICISRIKKCYPGDTFFYNTYNYKLADFKEYEEFDYLEYTPGRNTNERQYLNLMEKILKEGFEQPDRTKVGTRTLIGEKLVFDLQEGFPLITTKKMAWKSIQEELFMFLSGKTDTKELEAKGVNIWRAHTSAQFLQQNNLDYEEGEMGPMYGFQWRNFGGLGLDQLTKVIKELEVNPFSRRLVMTSFNPSDADKGVLYPCHGLVIHFCCRPAENGDMYLSLIMYQRSADVFLGLPFNIASYAIFLHLVARKVNMIPDKLIIMIGNAHLYETHLEVAKIQIERKPLVAPKLVITKDIEGWDLDESYLKLVGYFHYSQLKAEIAI